MTDNLPPPAVLDWLRQLQESGRGLLDEIPTMVSVRKVAKKLGRGVKTLRRWSEDKDIKFPRFYWLDRWTVRADQVVKWLEDRPGLPDQVELRDDIRRHHATRTVKENLYAP